LRSGRGRESRAFLCCVQTLEDYSAGKTSFTISMREGLSLTGVHGDKPGCCPSTDKEKHTAQKKKKKGKRGKGAHLAILLHAVDSMREKGKAIPRRGGIRSRPVQEKGNIYQPTWMGGRKDGGEWKRRWEGCGYTKTRRGRREP